MICAQSSIVGRVVDQHENEPIANVNIYLANYDIGASTDSEGYFRIDLPKDFSDPTIELTAIGFSSLSKKGSLFNIKCHSKPQLPHLSNLPFSGIKFAFKLNFLLHFSQ